MTDGRFPLVLAAWLVLSVQLNAQPAGELVPVPPIPTAPGILMDAPAPIIVPPTVLPSPGISMPDIAMPTIPEMPDVNGQGWTSDPVGRQLRYSAEVALSSLRMQFELSSKSFDLWLGQEDPIASRVEPWRLRHREILAELHAQLAAHSPPEADRVDTENLKALLGQIGQDGLRMEETFKQVYARLDALADRRVAYCEAQRTDLFMGCMHFEPEPVAAIPAGPDILGLFDQTLIRTFNFGTVSPVELTVLTFDEGRWIRSEDPQLRYGKPFLVEVEFDKPTSARFFEVPLRYAEDRSRSVRVFATSDAPEIFRSGPVILDDPKREE